MSAPTRRPTPAGRAALALYRTAPLAVRAHVHIRWWSAPFAPVAAELPATGRILEIGCGHGLFAAYAALSAPGRTVVGVDIDPHKISQARAAAHRLATSEPEPPSAGHAEPRLAFALDVSGAVPTGPWDAVSVVDMLYLLPAAEQRRLLSEAVAQLAPGGTLVIKEMGTRPLWKARWNTWQETLSVRVLHITEGSAFDFVDPVTMAGWLTDLGLTTQVRRLDRGRVHPHHLLVAVRAD